MKKFKSVIGWLPDVALEIAVEEAAETPVEVASV
jgi:hypothetical protein